MDSGGSGLVWPGGSVDVGGQRYEPVVLETLLVFCMRHMGSYSTVDTAWYKLLAVAMEVGLPLSARRMGVIYDDPACTEPDRIRYDACLVTSEAEITDLRLDAQDVLERGVRIESLAGIQAWRTVHRGGYRSLAKAYVALSASAVFADAGVRTVAGSPPYYEFYLTDPQVTPMDEQVTEVYLPISMEPSPV